MKKIKEGFLVRQIAGETVVLPAGNGVDLGLMITLNDTGRFLWERLEQGAEEDALVDALLAEYDVDAATARSAVERFIGKLEGNGFLA